jgi:hypothetical protein
LGLGAGLFFFVRILWPHLRRFLLLQFLVYFRLADGEKGPWTGRIWRLYETLKSYPSHMNQGMGVFALAFFGISIIVGITLTMLLMASVPTALSSYLSGILYILCLMWPLTALAGFYRLILSPAEPQPDSGDGPLVFPGTNGRKSR